MDKKEITLNPSLMLGVGLFPLIVVCTDLKSAIIFGAILFCVMILSQMLVGAFKQIIPKRVRFVCYALVILCSIYFVDSLVSELATKAYGNVHNLIVYVFASSIVLYCLENNRYVENFGEGLKNTSIVGVYYFLTLLVVGLIREILGSGSIWGSHIFGDFGGISFILTSAGGLLVVVVLALIYNTIACFVKKRKKVYDILVSRYKDVLDETVKPEIEQSSQEKTEEEE